MRIAFIGCVDFSRAALTQLVALETVEVVGVITRRASVLNADFSCLEDLAQKAGCPTHFADDNDQGAMATFLRSVRPDVVFCFGWSYLLGGEILQIPERGVVGFYPAALPQNRGRHPLIWALVLGLEATASTFFFMDEGADSGDVVSQERIPITSDDDAASLYRKVTETALAQINRFTSEIVAKNVHRIPQDHSRANTWRKRSKRDGEIDWRMSAHGIYNLVRALANPYPGAHCLYEGQEVKIWRVEVISAAPPANLEPGKVLEVSGGTLLVKCGEGAVRIVEHEFNSLPEAEDYL